ncbi:unnamed protein product [Didymodactylos carnosus]|uniref:ubiquitinyl hydrolase 1 n=1 Tax=Didymodactylos carnosus TaxID=1234261 RepID=A0A815RQX5_9BILA|nr:unnamed protein product [Didymodactylos carnosus]CAF4346243.1 unnamed protein product [Didymodactylos carnosus]
MTILSTKKQANERDNRKDETTSQHNHSSHRLSTSSSTVTTNTRSRQSIDDVQNQQQQQQQQLSGTSQTETDESSSSLLNTSTCKRKARSSPHRSTRRQRGNNNSNNNNNNNNASGSQSSGSNGVTGSNTPTSCNSSGNLVQQQHTTMQQQHLSSSSSSNYRWTKDMPCSSTTHIDYDENSQCNSEDEYEQTTFKYDKNNLNDLEMRFVRALKEKKSFVIKAIKEDGACLFRAVADQVLGDEDLHDTVRQNCMDYIVKNADFFRNYITEDFDHYVSRKRKHNCHGNHIEMIALSELYNRPIEVYEYSTEPINTVHGMYKTDNEPIRLSYHCGVHYNSVIDPWKPVPLDRGSVSIHIAQNTLIQNTIRQSEESHIEQAMLDDKIMATDWEATQDELIQQVARESYLEWVCETEQQRNKDKSVRSYNPINFVFHKTFTI